MKIYNENIMILPSEDKCWVKIPFGFSTNDVRLGAYFGIIIVICSNILGFIYIDSFLEKSFSWMRNYHLYTSLIIVLMLFLLTVLIYTIIHETIHLMFFPKNSANRYIGLKPPAMVFVLYNGEISINQFKKVLIAPFLLLLLPLTILFVYFPNMFTLNILVIHITGSFGDIQMIYKFRKVKQYKQLWTTGKETWFR